MQTIRFTDEELNHGKKQEYSPVAPGDYLVSIDRAEYITSKSGRPMISIVATIGHGDFGGRKLFDFFLMDHNVGRGRLGQLVNCLGMSTLEIPDMPGTKEDPASVFDLTGKAAIAVVGIDKKDSSRNIVYRYQSVEAPQEPQKQGSLTDVPFGY